MDSGNPDSPEPASSTPPHAFNTKDAARYIGMSPSWLRKARMGIGGPGPNFKKVGRRVIYTVDSLKKFLDS